MVGFGSTAETAGHAGNSLAGFFLEPTVEKSRIGIGFAPPHGRPRTTTQQTFCLHECTLWTGRKPPYFNRSQCGQVVGSGDSVNDTELTGALGRTPFSAENEIVQRR